MVRNMHKKPHLFQVESFYFNWEEVGRMLKDGFIAILNLGFFVINLCLLGIPIYLIRLNLWKKLVKDDKRIYGKDYKKEMNE